MHPETEQNRQTFCLVNKLNGLGASAFRKAERDHLQGLFPKLRPCQDQRKHHLV